jgi:hypothetical protein
MRLLLVFSLVQAAAAAALCSTVYDAADDPSKCPSGALKATDFETAECTTNTCVDGDDDDALCCEDPWGSTGPSTGPSDEVTTKALCSTVYDAADDPSKCPSGALKVTDFETAECTTNTCVDGDDDDALCCEPITTGETTGVPSTTGETTGVPSTTALSTSASSSEPSQTTGGEESNLVLESAPTTDTVKISTTISGVDYSLLSAEQLDALEESLVETFAQAAGVPTAQTSVEMSEGSVLVVATITATEGETILETEVIAPEAASIVAAVKSVPNIADATENGAEITASEPEAVLFKAGETTATQVTATQVTPVTTSTATGTIGTATGISTTGGDGVSTSEAATRPQAIPTPPPASTTIESNASEPSGVSRLVATTSTAVLTLLHWIAC